MVNNIGKNIVDLRKQKGISQKEITKICNTSLTSVSHWENGIDVPDLDTLILLADYFNITLDELIL